MHHFASPSCVGAIRVMEPIGRCHQHALPNTIIRVDMVNSASRTVTQPVHRFVDHQFFTMGLRLQRADDEQRNVVTVDQRHRPSVFILLGAARVKTPAGSRRTIPTQVGERLGLGDHDTHALHLFGAQRTPVEPQASPGRDRGFQCDAVIALRSDRSSGQARSTPSEQHSHDNRSHNNNLCWINVKARGFASYPTPSLRGVARPHIPPRHRTGRGGGAMDVRRLGALAARTPATRSLIRRAVTGGATGSHRCSGGKGLANVGERASNRTHERLLNQSALLFLTPRAGLFRFRSSAAHSTANGTLTLVKDHDADFATNTDFPRCITAGHSNQVALKPEYRERPFTHLTRQGGQLGARLQHQHVAGLPHRGQHLARQRLVGDAILVIATVGHGPDHNHVALPLKRDGHRPRSARRSRRTPRCYGVARPHVHRLDLGDRGRRLRTHHGFSIALRAPQRRQRSRGANVPKGGRRSSTYCRMRIGERLLQRSGRLRSTTVAQNESCAYAHTEVAGVVKEPNEGRVLLCRCQVREAKAERYQRHAPGTSLRDSVGTQAWRGTATNVWRRLSTSG